MADYKDTLHLPNTDFSMRANLAQKEPEMVARWQQEKLFEQILEQRKDAPKFVLHDGPPYANGQIHHGTVLNKILKDMIVRDRNMAGFYTDYVPGWDCHGLPIEVQVDKELGAKKATLTRREMRVAYREYAQKFIDLQREQFKRLGVLGRFENPYKTMDPAYEAQTLRELSLFAENGLLYKGLKPVNWCAVHQTALAEAEVEYEDHTSPSIYVAFELITKPAGFSEPLDVVIWTTTPWTLPANLAVAVHPDFDYVIYPVKGRNRIVAKELLAAFLTAVGESEVDAQKIRAEFKGKDLEHLKYRHPLMKRESPVILGQHVTLEAGTGCVHTAPGHGAEDFLVGQKYGLDILNPVDEAGVFKAEAGVYAGLKVFEANKQIIADLQSALLSDPSLTVKHRYAHCWRCHKPILIRATEQWWVAMDKPYGDDNKTLRERALAALHEVEWIPEWGYDRIYGMLSVRPDWCLSRQRVWGVPIAVVYCEKCNTPVVKPKYMQQVADLIEEHGVDIWYEWPVEKLLGDLKCESCGHQSFRKEHDILDVWFDSGVSFAAVIEKRGLGHQNDGPPVDLYLEGSDQHRGWFHSSLLCSLATRKKPPYKQVLTHGFVVDGDGKKISKSKGNFVDPFKTIAESGAEILRLWVAGEEYREDVRISKEILTRLSEMYRKLRNTIRFLLGNISDFNPNEDWVSEEQMLDIDVYALALLQKATVKVRTAYDAKVLHGAVHTLNEFCTVDLSSFYLDVLKDRLYASAKNSVLRRSAQTAMYVIARDLLRLMAPILCFTTEEAWYYLPKLKDDLNSVHLHCYPQVKDSDKLRALYAFATEKSEVLCKHYDALLELRRAVNVKLEEARRDKQIGSSTEAEVTLQVSDLEKFKAFGTAKLEEICIVSRVVLQHGAETLNIQIAKAPGTKCPRCWLYREEVGAQEICHRCTEAIS